MLCSQERHPLSANVERQMKNRCSRLVVGLIALLTILGDLTCVTSPSSRSGDQATIENNVFGLTLKKTPAPYISSLVHKASGIALVSEPSERALFAILFAEPEGQNYVDSSLAGKTSLEVNRTTKGSEVVITYGGFPNLDLSARVHGTFSDQDPVSVWSIEVHNHTGRKMERVRFPLLEALPAIGDAGDDFLVFPMSAGVMIKNPRKNWPVDFGPWPSSPGPLSAQFVTYQDATAGIYLASRDTESHQKILSIWKSIWKKEDGFGVCHDYFLSDDAGDDWESPYAVSIGVTQGAWRDSADIYKSWAVTQTWCAKTLSQRADVPAWLRKGPLVYSSSMRTYDQKGIETGSYYPRLLEALRYLKRQTGTPILAMLADWEKHRRWTAGDCFPAFDEKNAQTVVSQIKSEGFRPFLFLSGLNYTFENEGPGGSKIPVPDGLLSQFVVDGKTGSPRAFSLEESFFSSAWKRRSYAFCVGTKGIQPFFRTMIDESLKLGVSVLQMDQTIDGAGEPCFSRQHEHAPGIGTYQTQGFQTLLQDMRAYGKGKDLDFALFLEEPHEQLIPFLDGFHMREYIEGLWYRGMPGAVGIPLFSYLYHEYAIGYGGDSAPIGPKGANAAWNVRCHAVNLVTGRTPGAATWMFPDQLFNAEPRALRMVRSHMRLLNAGASRYLMEGTMLHPFEIDAPPLTYSVNQYELGKSVQVEFTESSILTSSWRAPDGCVGHVFVNLSSEAQSIDVVVDARKAPAGRLFDASVFRSERGDRFVPLWGGVHLPKHFSAVVAPDEVLLLELRRTGE
jgi:hypothetical protein